MASQTKKKFLSWFTRSTGKSSSSKPPKKSLPALGPAPAPSQSSIEVELELPSRGSPRLAPPSPSLPSPMPALSPTELPSGGRDDDRVLQIEVPLLPSHRSPQLTPPSPLLPSRMAILSPTSLPTWSRDDQVPQSEMQQSSSRRELAEFSTPSPRGTRNGQPASATETMPSQSAADSQPETILIQDVFQSSSGLQAEGVDSKESTKAKSPVHQEEILPQESQLPKQAEPDYQLTEAGNKSAEDLEGKTETLIRIVSAISDEKTVSEHKTDEVQGETTVFPETMANYYPSQLPQIHDTVIKAKEKTQPSQRKQADHEPEQDSELRRQHEELEEERFKHINGETITKDLANAKDASPSSQQSGKKDQGIKEERPEANQPTSSPHTSTEDLKDKREPLVYIEETHAKPSQVLAERRDPRNHENEKSSRENAHTTLIPNIPQASPTIPGYNSNMESDGRSNLVQKLKITYSQYSGDECGLSTITLVGENTGASMHIRGETLDKSCRGYKLDNHPTSADRNVKKKVPKERSDDEDTLITTSVNSNVQSINNSLLHQCSCSQEDPGVHLILSSKPTKPPSQRMS